MHYIIINLKETFKLHPTHCVLLSIFAILTSICGIYEVLIMEGIVNAISAFSIIEIWKFAVLLIGIYLWNYFSEPLHEIVEKRFTFLLQDKYELKVAEKLFSIRASYLESEFHQQLFQRMQDEPSKKVVNLWSMLLGLMGDIITLFGLFLLIKNAGLKIFLIIGVMIIIMLICFKNVEEQHVKLYQIRQEYTRRSGYLSSIFFDRNLAMERKLYQYTDFLHNEYKKETCNSQRNLQRGMLYVSVVQFVYGNVVYIFSVLTYLFLLPSLIQGTIDIGLYVAVPISLMRIGNILVKLISNKFPEIKKTSNYLKDMDMFFDLENQYYNVESSSIVREDKTFSTIVFEDVCFAYPGSDIFILNHLSATFEYGKKYALVGLNGSGKSTLVKLLLGFYKPNSGRILIDGHDINNLSFEEVATYFGVVFQDFTCYNLSIKDNIAVGNMAKSDNKLLLIQASQDAGIDADIESLPREYETILGKLFDDSVDFSMGQWQKLATARMFFRNAPFLILDEPTASLDPIAESRLYENFIYQMDKSRTSLFVSHRLGAAVMSDVIFVLDKGFIVEEGSHKELMKLENGLYSRMFTEQRGLYF